MKILRTVAQLDEFAATEKKRNKILGLVPTMGALHKGHLSLVERARSECSCIIASLFVNPTQFNNPDDLASYPRNEDADFKLLEEAGVDAVFAPSVEEIYPDEQSRNPFVPDLGTAAEVMEGKYRPGHFRGVAIIVGRLFDLVKPDKAFFGEKDFQQIAVIRNLTKALGRGPEIVACPIKRADDGLALSSRNALLTPEQRKTAPEIYATLKHSAGYSLSHSVSATHDTVTERIDSLPECRVEYFEIVDGRTLLPVSDWNDSDYIVGCITVYCGKVRLIDNITYRKPSTQAL